MIEVSGDRRRGRGGTPFLPFSMPLLPPPQSGANRPAASGGSVATAERQNNRIRPSAPGGRVTGLTFVQNPRCSNIRRITTASLMKLTISISAPQCGHASGSTSQTFLMHSRQTFKGIRRGLCSATPKASTGGSDRNPSPASTPLSSFAVADPPVPGCNTIRNTAPVTAPMPPPFNTEHRLEKGKETHIGAEAEPA